MNYGEAPVRPFCDPDPFHELGFPSPIAARRAIADEIRVPLAKLSADDRASGRTSLRGYSYALDFKRPLFRTPIRSAICTINFG